MPVTWWRGTEFTRPGTFQPILFVTLRQGTRQIEVPALVDSGADQVLVPMRFLAGVSWMSLARLPNVRGLGGTAEQAECPGEILYEDDVISSPLRVTNASLTTVLLGRNGFLSKFDVCYDWDDVAPRFSVERRG